MAAESRRPTVLHCVGGDVHMLRELVRAGKGGKGHLEYALEYPHVTARSVSGAGSFL